MSASSDAFGMSKSNDESVDAPMTPPGSPYPHSGASYHTKPESNDDNGVRTESNDGRAPEDGDQRREQRGGYYSGRSSRFDDRRRGDYSPRRRGGGRRGDSYFPERPIPPPSSVLAFFNLGRDVRLKELQEWVEMHAPVQDVELILDRNDVPKGFAFITFNSVDDATTVMGALHEKEFNNRNVRVTYSTSDGRTNDTKPRREARYDIVPDPRRDRYPPRDSRNYRRDDFRDHPYRGGGGGGGGGYGERRYDDRYRDSYNPGRGGGRGYYDDRRDPRDRDGGGFYRR